MNDEKLIAAAQDAVRILIRRPHAYKFRSEHTGAPVPGLSVFDGDGQFLGGAALPSDDAVAKVTELLKTKQK